MCWQVFFHPYYTKYEETIHKKFNYFLLSNYAYLYKHNKMCAFRLTASFAVILIEDSFSAYIDWYGSYW